MKQRALMAAMLAAAVALAGCSIDPYTGEEKVSNTGKGAGIGAATGAVIGAATSGSKDHKKGALIGAAAGAAIGGGVGYYMDTQEKKLRQQLEGTGVRVQRVGDSIKLIMPGNITFAVGSEQIATDFYEVLNSVAVVLREYNKTAIDIKGYTDSTGSFEFNQSLSERRAESVARYLINQQITPGRVRTAGYGPRYPIADNSSEAGRSQNRRVEINLVPMQ